MGKKQRNKTEIVPETYEQYRERSIKELSSHIKFISEPTYIFAVGDVVQAGGLERPTVFEVIEGGKIYGIESIKGEKKWFYWTSVRKIVDKTENEYGKRDDMFLQYYQTPLYSLLHKLYYSGVDFNPYYQRPLEWKIQDKEELIDSIFNSIDIGKFVFVFKGYSDSYMDEVLDGKQRLNTIKEYYEDRFPYKGKYFSDLSIKDKDHFTNFKVNVAETDELTEEQKLRYFIKLNTTGKIMNKAHLEQVKEKYKQIVKHSTSKGMISNE